MAREASGIVSSANLARAGFEDSDLAAERLIALGPPAWPVVSILGRTADPDLALATLTRLHEVVADPAALLSTLEEDEGTAMRLLSVIGMSAALGEHLLRHPDHWRELTDPTLGSTRPPAYAVRGALLGAVGALVLIDAARLVVPYSQSDPVGPKALPMIVGGLLLICAVLLAVNVLRGGRGEAEAGEDGGEHDSTLERWQCSVQLT